MAANQDRNIPHDMRKIYRRIFRWRGSHTGRLPIPEPLWAEAAELVQERGINATAKVLHLEYGKLKEKTLALGQAKGVERSRAERSRCLKGKVCRQKDPALRIRVIGQAPIEATVYTASR